MVSVDGESEQTRFGFIALIGLPNTGKSTLINRLVGDKVAIVTPKAQTTRCRVVGLCVSGSSQLAFIDTPGIYEPRHRLDRAMVQTAWRGIEEADIVVLLLDATRRYGAVAQTLVQNVGKSARMVVLAINKIDKVERSRLLPLVAEVTTGRSFTATYMISALTGDGVDSMREALANMVPAGSWLYPGDQMMDMPARVWAAEITREILFCRLHKEIPYALAVTTEEWRELEDGSLRIEQRIQVKRESHKPIVVGQGGRQIKGIGKSARMELEKILGRRVHLFLRVKVDPKWQDDPERYREMGLMFPR